MNKNNLVLLSLVSAFILICNSPSMARENSSLTEDIRLDLFEVSTLFPLPKQAEDLNLLIAPGTQPNLLPEEIFNKVPFFINKPNQEVYPTLRVIGVRIDPCFMEGRGPLRCDRQVRFIWQPVVAVEGKITTIDASLHTFFRLNDIEFKRLVENLKSLKRDYISEFPQFNTTALGVHPVLANLGLQSDFSVRLKQIFLNSISEKSMHRMTFMKLKGVNDIWIFGGFDFQASGKSEPIQIPRLDHELQQDFINSLAMRPNPTQFSGGIFPSPDETDLFNEIAKDSFDIDSRREHELRAMIRSIADFENPEKHNPGTLDCVTCHLANTMRSWSYINFTDLNLQADYDAVKFNNPNYILQNPSARQGQTNVLRMFGYFEEAPFVALRTINETSEVLRFLEDN